MAFIKLATYGGSPGLVVMGGDSRLKIVGSNPSAVYCMDIFHIKICCKLELKFV